MNKKILKNRLCDINNVWLLSPKCSIAKPQIDIKTEKCAAPIHNKVQTLKKSVN